MLERKIKPVPAMAGICMAIMSACFVSDLRADGRIALKAERTRYDLGRRVEILEDKTGRLAFKDVRRARDWKPSEQDVVNFAFSDSVFWIRARIENSGAAARDMVLELAFPLHDYVDAYIEGEHGEFRVVKTGDRRTFGTREIDHPHFLFPIRIPASGTRLVYLRFQSHDGLHESAPLVLWERRAFAEYDSLTNYVNGLLFGFLLIMLFYNLFVYISLRDRSYLYYVFFLTSSVFWFFSYQGMAFRVLWPEFPSLANLITPISSAFIVITHIVYARSYLETPERARILDLLFKICFIPWPAILLFAFFDAYKVSILLIAPFIIIVLSYTIIAGIIRVWQGHRPARFYVSSFLMLILGVAMMTLKVVDVLPSNVLTEKSILIGFALAVLLLALGLADRINVIREERAAAQQAALEKETEARKAQERSAADLKRMNELKDSFLANTSHELRTPLQGIIGMADALRDDHEQELSAPSERRLELIMASGRRLSRLVGDILDFSRLRYKDIQLRLANVGPRPLVQLQLELIAYNQPPGRKLSFHNDVPGDLPAVRADEGRLAQVLQNLLGNAVKFTEAGEIRVSARRMEKGMIEFRVSDTGPGIAPGDRERIFEPFEQAGDAMGGTGLGLSIARSLVELQGGTLWVEEGTATGATVCFTLPRADEREEATPVPAEQDARSTLEHMLPGIADPGQGLGAKEIRSNGHNGRRVLLVDDEPVNLEVMRSYLEHGDLSVETATDAKAARKLLSRGALPDCLVLDIMMPEVSGLELAREIRAEHSRVELPILMVTAKTRAADLTAALDAGANDYLMKPFEKKEFVLRVNNLAELAHSRRDVERSRSALRDAARRERARINADLHDHLGASLTDLKLFSETARDNPDVDEEFARRLEGKVDGAVRVLRNDLLSLEDLSLLEDDFMAGIQMIILRRYVEAGRVMDFRAPEEGREELNLRLQRGHVAVLYAVIKETVTNDLKYGVGQSIWKFSWDAREIHIDFQAYSRYHLASHGTGRGTEGMIRRLAEVGGNLRMSLQDESSEDPRPIQVEISMPL